MEGVYFDTYWNYNTWKNTFNQTWSSQRCTAALRHYEPQIPACQWTFIDANDYVHGRELQPTRLARFEFKWIFPIHHYKNSCRDQNQAELMKKQFSFVIFAVVLLWESHDWSAVAISFCLRYGSRGCFHCEYYTGGKSMAAPRVSLHPTINQVYRVAGALKKWRILKKMQVSRQEFARYRSL